MEHRTLPPYTPSAPSPEYSNELLSGEQTVEIARHVTSRPTSGVYRRITDRLTVVLRDQLPGSLYPVYGRGGVIRGDVILGHVSGFTSVVLKLEGSFILHASAVPVSSFFLSTTYVLWNACGAKPCPKTIPFAAVLPLTFDDHGQARALPPTVESAEPHAGCSYSLTVELSRPQQFLSFLKGSAGVKVPFLYCPRSRPHVPMLPSNLPFTSTVKSSPEEWREIICALSMSQGSGLAPVECLLFTPSVQIYAFSDTIPFHLQICGSPASLIPFLEQGQDRGQGVIDQQNGVIIRVYLLRQITVRIYGQSATASRILGEGKLEPSQTLRSKYHALLQHPPGEGLESLDWDGVLGCSEDVTVPGFFTNQFSIKDSIVLSINPRQPLKSPLLGITSFHPIRLVTDPWSNDSA